MSDQRVPRIGEVRRGHKSTLVCSGDMRPRLWLGRWSCDCGQATTPKDWADR